MWNIAHERAEPKPRSILWESYHETIAFVQDNPKSLLFFHCYRIHKAVINFLKNGYNESAHKSIFSSGILGLVIWLYQRIRLMSI